MCEDIPDDMEYEVVPSKTHLGDWQVEAIDYEGEGEIYLTPFCGPGAQARAEEYAAFKREHQ